MTATLNWATFSPQAELGRRLHKVEPSCPAAWPLVCSRHRGQTHIMTDPRDHTAPRFRAWDVGIAAGRDGLDGTANGPCDDTRDHRDDHRGSQSGHPHFQSARQPTSGAGEPAQTRRSSRDRRNNIRSCAFCFLLIWGIYERCAVTSFERNDFDLRREMKKTNLKWEKISIT